MAAGVADKDEIDGIGIGAACRRAVASEGGDACAGFQFPMFQRFLQRSTNC